MKNQYRFLGDWAELEGIVRLSRFGQQVELTDEVAHKAVAENLPIVPEDIWEGLDISDEECKRYPNAIQQNRAPADFLEKKGKALIALQDYREFVASAKQ